MKTHRVLTGRVRYRAGGPKNLQLVLQVQLYGRAVPERPGYATTRWADALTQDLAGLMEMNLGNITVNAILPDDDEPPAGGMPHGPSIH